MTTQSRKMLPISSLYISAENMRKSKPSKKSDAELLASIKASGLIQNLVVGKKTERGYPVEAGGRRFTQCMKLVESGHFKENESIPVLILADGQSAKDISLVENFMREKAHPVDEFEAFLYLHETDEFSVADIAARFGQTKKYIKQRLLLAGVAPELRGYCRNGLFGVDILEAFTVTDDHESQLSAYNECKDDDDFTSYDIKRFLTSESKTTKDRQAVYLGMKCYRKAGGTTIDDLFGEHTYINDVKLLERLVEEKIEAETVSLSKKWSWLEFVTNLMPWQVNSYTKIAKEFDVEPIELVEKLGKQKARHAELDEIPWDEKTDAQETEYDELDSEIDDIEIELEDIKVFVASEVEFAGCLVTLNSDGKLDVYEGLVKDADVSRLSAFRNPEGEKELIVEDETPDRVESIYNQALQQDLSAYRKSIAKASVAANGNLGNDMALFSVCYPVFSNAFNQFPLMVQVKDSNEETSKNDIKGSRAHIELEESLSRLDRGWVGEDSLASLKSFRALTQKTKRELSAFAAAYSLCGYSLGSGESDLAKYIFEESKVDVSEYFRPTANNFFKRIKEPHFSNLVVEILGAEWLEKNSDKKRPYIAEKMELAVAGDAPKGGPLTLELLNKWMPKDF